MAEERELKPWDDLPFEELGVNGQLAYACEELGWKTPTKMQREFIPAALKGKDIIGLGQTGPGKTEAFVIPILQGFMKIRHACVALVLCPTGELAIQVAERFEAFGGVYCGTRCAVLVEGVDDFVQQSIVLRRRPHIVVATPRRLVDHLCAPNAFSLRMFKFLVLDEADKLLNDHSELVDEILNVIPPKLTTFLFSATMTQKVQKLQGALLKDPVMINAASKYNLRQQVREAKGISQIKMKEGGKKRRKCHEDDARNCQASNKKHHRAPRPLTELGKKLKDKLEELSRRASPKKTCEEVHEDGSYSYKLVYPDGVTVSVHNCGDDSDGEYYDEEDDEEDDEEEEWDTTKLPKLPRPELPPSPYDPSYVEPPMLFLCRATNVLD